MKWERQWLVNGPVSTLESPPFPLHHHDCWPILCKIVLYCNVSAGANPAGRIFSIGASNSVQATDGQNNVQHPNRFFSLSFFRFLCISCDYTQAPTFTTTCPAATFFVYDKEPRERKCRERCVYLFLLLSTRFLSLSLSDALMPGCISTLGWMTNPAEKRWSDGQQREAPSSYPFIVAVAVVWKE